MHFIYEIHKRFHSSYSIRLEGRPTQLQIDDAVWRTTLKRHTFKAEKMVIFNSSNIQLLHILIDKIHTTFVSFLKIQFKHFHFSYSYFLSFLFFLERHFISLAKQTLKRIVFFHKASSEFSPIPVFFFFSGSVTRPCILYFVLVYASSS